MPSEGMVTAPPASLEVSRDPDATLRVRLAGTWRLETETPSPAEVEAELSRGNVSRVSVDASGVSSWDSALVVFLARLVAACRARSTPIERAGLPTGLQRLLDLVQDSATLEGRAEGRPAFLEQIGERSLLLLGRAKDTNGFVGSTTLALARFALRRARYRSADLGLLVQGAGPEALPIVALVNFLVGIILAFVGITQLRRFGAEHYIADIVGIAVVRDMAALITGVVLAGRSGAAYAAQIATMQVTQEVDALRTLGISPVEFLVVPRVVALTLMMPFLTLFADAMGVLGGAAVGTTMMHQALAAYLRQTAASVTSGDIAGGLLKGATYGSLVAFAGTLRGMQAERSSERVGEAATQAVVSGIVLIIAACGVYQYVFFLFGW
ncbi:MAG TPA: ABC transporter permease [Anaeromyxobacteraceae bacterium]|nr:ABC transporter permease [Anaeromyxobacteraceae bacterium]